MTTAKVKDYKGAKILILNDDWQTFIYVIFYKGEFYANNIYVTKQGEYTNREYMEAMEAVLDVAHKIIDKLEIERSPILNKLRKLCQLKMVKQNILRLIGSQSEKEKV